MKITIESAADETIEFENVQSFSGCIEQVSPGGIACCKATTIGSYTDVDRIKITASLYDVIEEMVDGFQRAPEVPERAADCRHEHPDMGNIIFFPKREQGLFDDSDFVVGLVVKKMSIQYIRDQLEIVRNRRHVHIACPASMFP